MPTGYTYEIKDGISFEQFVLRCSRAMGALILMRNEPLDAPIPDSFPPSDFHIKELEKLNARSAFLAQLTNDQIKELSEQSYLEAYNDWQKHENEKLDLANKYKEMLAKVVAWQPPTEDHVEFKAFMIQQISESLKWDCNSWDPPIKLTPEEWYEKELDDNKKGIAYHLRENELEIKRSKNRTEWVVALKQSLQLSPL